MRQQGLDAFGDGREGIELSRQTLGEDLLSWRYSGIPSTNLPVTTSAWHKNAQSLEWPRPPGPATLQASTKPVAPSPTPELPHALPPLEFLLGVAPVAE